MFPEDQLRVVLTIIASMPLSLLLYKLPTTDVRKYFSIIVGAYLQFYVYGHEVWISFAMHALIYSIIVVKGRQCGFVVLLIAILLLSVYHIYRMIVDYGGWTLDVSTILMGNVCKYSLFAFSYEDGGKTDQKLKTEDQKKQKLVQLPSFIDFFSYCVFLPTCVVATPITYRRYLLYINKQQQFKDIPHGQSLVKLGKDALLAVIFAGIHVFGLLYFPNTIMTMPDYMSKGFWYLMYFGFFNMFITNQFKYFFAFKICMLPIHISGLSYEPTSKQADQFQGVSYIDIWTFVTTLNPQTKINSWNLTVQQWLRKCVYQRLTTSKQTAKLLTFLFSAFWHGFYGGYYITFTIFFVQLHLANLTYKLSKNESHPLIKLYKKFEPISYYLTWICITFLFYHNGHYFPLLFLDQGWEILKTIYFLPPILILIPIAIFTFWKEGRPIEKTQKLN